MTLFLLLLLGAVTTASAAQSQPAVVVVPVTDVWSRPIVVGEKPSDDLRETQLLANEVVLIHESSGAWVRIEALDQPEFTHHHLWEGYPGWVLSTSVASTKIKPKIRHAREAILPFAESTLNTPYLWGGMSPPVGVDCSGLVHLAYRKFGMRIPRDAYEQWMKAKPISRAQLKPADLIFSSKEDHPKKITHVAIYAGDGQIIEAPQNGMVVRKISFKEKYGKDLDQVVSGDHVGERYIYFGSFLQK